MRPYHLNMGSDPLKTFLQGNKMKRYVLLLLLATTSIECVAGWKEGFTFYKAGKYKTALKELLPSANGGNADAQYLIGDIYSSGLGVDRKEDYVAINNSQAVGWYRKAAVQGHPYAQFALGLMYKIGEVVPQDYSQAADWYRKAAEQGLYSAQNSLGEIYRYGEGVPQNYSQAINWYRKAAEQGDTKSLFALGLMYYNGEGVPQNYSQAADWYRKAAEQGDTKSLFNLGEMYKKGEGVAKNLVLAHIFYNLAAVNGDEYRKSRDEITVKLTSAQLSEAQELASKWVINQPLPTITQTYPSSSKEN